MFVQLRFVPPVPNERQHYSITDMIVYWSCLLTHVGVDVSQGLFHDLIQHSCCVSTLQGDTLKDRHRYE